MSARNKVGQERFWDLWRQSGAVGWATLYGMSTDGPTPPPCDSKIFEKGRGVCILEGSSNAVETWVKAVAQRANAQVDWHYSGGRANVLHLGDDESRERVLNAIDELKAELKGSILSVDAPALYRNGVEDPNETGAVVHKIDGRLVLEDPTVGAVITAVGKFNCKNTLELNADRVAYFKQRLADRGLTPKDAVIVLVNVADVHGGPLAQILMPGYNWQEIWEKGEVPFARGLADRAGIQSVLCSFDAAAATKLQEMAQAAVVVVDHGVAEVFAA